MLEWLANTFGSFYRPYLGAGTLVKSLYRRLKPQARQA
jgi:hypothetical protein